MRLHHSCRARACTHTQPHTHTHHWSNSAGATISLGRLAAAPSRIDPHRARQGRSALHLNAPSPHLVQGGCFGEHAYKRYLGGGSSSTGHGGVSFVRNARAGSGSGFNTITAHMAMQHHLIACMFESVIARTGLTNLDGARAHEPIVFGVPRALASTWSQLLHARTLAHTNTHTGVE